jgi:hypothetical protein
MSAVYHPRAAYKSRQRSVTPRLRDGDAAHGDRSGRANHGDLVVSAGNVPECNRLGSAEPHETTGTLLPQGVSLDRCELCEAGAWLIGRAAVELERVDCAVYRVECQALPSLTLRKQPASVEPIAHVR